LPLHKLRRVMVDAGRNLLEGVVEIDETEMPLRRKAEPPAGGQGRSPIGKMPIAGAAEPEGATRTHGRGADPPYRLAVARSRRDPTPPALPPRPSPSGHQPVHTGWRVSGLEGTSLGSSTRKA